MTVAVWRRWLLRTRMRIQKTLPIVPKIIKTGEQYIHMFTPIWNSEYDAGEEKFSESEVPPKKDEKEEIRLAFYITR